jgi:cytochrome c biogenesis protein
MFVPQNAPHEEYISRYGQRLGGFVQLTGLGSVYRVWWYLLLIILVLINLLVCSAGRIKRSFRQAFSRPRAQDNELLQDTKPIGLEVAPALLRDALARRLRAKGYSVDSVENGPLGLIAAQRGAVSRIGFLITHLSIIAILVAGAINGRLGYRHQQDVRIGESFAAGDIEPGADFDVRLDDFQIETAETGQVRDYKSVLTVIQGGQKVLTKTVEVNHPLIYGGLGFYQASYGQDPSAIKDARLFYSEDTFESADDSQSPHGESPHGGTPPVELILPFRQKAPVPGTDLEAVITDYVPHFVKDLATGVVSSRSDEPKLPAIKLDVLQDGKVVDSGWLIEGMDFHSRGTLLGRFHFVWYTPLFYAGIDVAKNPGVPLLFVGFAIASVGIFLSFFIPWERIWIKIDQQGPGRSHVRITGTSSKGQGGFKRQLEKLREFAAGAERWEKGDEGGR